MPLSSSRAPNPSSEVIGFPGAKQPPRLRVLVSDDHPVNRVVIVMLLSEFGAQVEITENGLEACEAFEAGAFDLVMLDMQMPVMDGLAAARRIREFERQQQKARTPVVIVTANALPQHRLAGLAAGADGFLTKPLELDELEAVLNRFQDEVQRSSSPQG